MGTPDEGCTVIAVDQCAQWVCGLGVTTKSSDDTLPFVQFSIEMLKGWTGMTVKCMVCDGGRDFINAACMLPCMFPEI